ncbi:MAG: TIGR02594 family protein [Oceanicaulis sp.]
MPVHDRALEAALPPAYAFLARHPGPPILLEALALYGTVETPGPASNPVIDGWLAELVLANAVPAWAGDVFTDDAVPWCGLFAAICAHRAGCAVPAKFLRAREWTGFGDPVDAPAVGDVLVFWRGKRHGTAGHVGLYAGEDAEAFHVLGGNQSDAVTITRIARDRLLAARRAPVKPGGHPGWGEPALIEPGGAGLSTNEA